jgi:hypothetical protein
VRDGYQVLPVDSFQLYEYISSMFQTRSLETCSARRLLATMHFCSHSDRVPAYFASGRVDELMIPAQRVMELNLT